AQTATKKLAPTISAALIPMSNARLRAPAVCVTDCDILLLLKPRCDRDLRACFQRCVAVDAPRRRQKVLPTTWRQPPALRSETTRSSARRLRISNGEKRGGTRVRPSGLSSVMEPIQESLWRLP